MKYFYSVLFFWGFMLNLEAQWVSIPDAAFASYLQVRFPSCLNGNLMDTTCAGVVSATALDCHSYNISNLSGIQYFDSLQKLLCYGNQLSSLPNLPSSLTWLECYGNQLGLLPTLPGNLILLWCWDNQLNNLPPLPNSLIELACGGNNLSNLPALPNGLNLLNCDLNQLHTLPTLPDSLTNLSCGRNPLISMPPLPNGLTILSCLYSPLTSLPALPNTLERLYGYDNQFSTLPELPDYLFICDVHNNPLICLPQLKRIEHLDFSNSLVTCLPNYGNVGASVPFLNSLPLCDSANNTHGCQIFNSFSAISNPQFAISLSPNPFSSSLSISLQKENLQQASFTITNIIGQPVYTKHESNLSSTYTKTLDLGYLPAGIYFLEVIADGERSVRELVKE